MLELTEDTAIVEYNINQELIDIAENISKHSPRILGLGVYIWNASYIRNLIPLIRAALPNTIIVLGGPEVSFEIEAQELTRLADYVITGEADHTFVKLCRTLLANQPPEKKVLYSPIPELETVHLPYQYYSDEDLRHRVVYVEASRGCPFTCEFCLSSLEVPVRSIEIERFLSEMEKLYQRGLRQFKFVDRTFNLNIRFALSLLNFFLERYEPGMLVHFEMVPDRLPPALRETIQKFPPGALQFEIGIQTFNPEVSTLISRRQDYTKIDENLTFLRKETGVHLHVDLIAGLPGETLESFAAGFNRLLALNPHEIQVGILKRLRGTPIIRHTDEWQMLYSDHPPYEILSTRTWPFTDLVRMRRFAKYWDLYSNSGRFSKTIPLLWKTNSSPFHAFLEFSDWLFSQVGQRHGIALQSLIDSLWRYLTGKLFLGESLVASTLCADFIENNHFDFLPQRIRELSSFSDSKSALLSQRGGRVRQDRHLRQS